MMTPVKFAVAALLVVQIARVESLNLWNCGIPNCCSSQFGLPSICGPKTTCCTSLPNDCTICTEKKVCVSPKVPSVVYLPLPLAIAQQLLAAGYSCGPVIPSCGLNRGLLASFGCGKTTTCTTLPSSCGKTHTTCTTVPHDNPVLSKTTMCTTLPLATCDSCCDPCSCGFQLPCKSQCGKSCLDWSSC